MIDLRVIRVVNGSKVPVTKYKKAPQIFAPSQKTLRVIDEGETSEHGNLSDGTVFKDG